MNRRNFLSSIIGGVTATAAVRTWPFRVYSFPTTITIVGPAVTIVGPAVSVGFRSLRSGRDFIPMTVKLFNALVVTNPRFHTRITNVRAFDAQGRETKLITL
jgi:hypothetical protein